MDGTHLDDPAQVATGFGQNGLDALARSLGLVCDAALDQRAGFVGGDLARDEDVWTGLDGLAVWADGWGDVSA